MKLAILLLLMSLPVLSQTSSIDVERKLIFPNTQALKLWAEKEYFGGGFVDLVTNDGMEVAIARRSFASGIPTCALSVFVKSAEGWEEGLKLRTYRGRWLDFTQDGDTVFVRDHKSKVEVLRFSIAQLSHQPVETKKK